jgi:hypothetical protein
MTESDEVAQTIFDGMAQKQKDSITGFHDSLNYVESIMNESHIIMSNVAESLWHLLKK